MAAAYLDDSATGGRPVRPGDIQARRYSTDAPRGVKRFKVVEIL